MSTPCEQYKLQNKLAKKNFKLHLNHYFNIDIDIPNFWGVYTKGLPHNENGQVGNDACNILINALLNNKLDKQYRLQLLSQVPLGGPRKLVNPSVIFDLEVTNSIPSSFKAYNPPSIQSDEGASELIEVFEMSFLRDVPFTEWGTNAEIQLACQNLSNIPDFYGPKINGQVTPETLFRGNSQGDLIGPYVSQFLLKDVPMGAMKIIQKYNVAPPNVNYVTTIENYLKVANGFVPEIKAPSIGQRYISSMRDGCVCVYNDEPTQLPLNALRILQSMNIPLAPGNPLRPNNLNSNEVGFVDLGIVDILDLIHRASKIGMNVVWWYKWQLLKARPEEYAFLLEKVANGLPIYLPNFLLNNSAIQRNIIKYGNRLLSQTTPDGCPLHSSFAGGHSVLGCIGDTILKAWFDENAIITNPVQASTDGLTLEPINTILTVRGELDKLTSNCGIFRNASGYHYRSDVDVSIEIGEEVATQVLQDFVKRYAQPVTFKFTKYNGQLVTITNQ